MDNWILDLLGGVEVTQGEDNESSPQLADPAGEPIEIKVEPGTPGEGSEPCLICLRPGQLLSSGDVSSAFSVGFSFEEKDCLGSHLCSVFILRHLLGFGRDRVASFLKKTRIDPGQWFSLCDQCFQLVNEGLEVHTQILLLTERMEGIRSEVEGSLCESLNEEQVEVDDGGIKSTYQMIRESYRDGGGGGGGLQNRRAERDDDKYYVPEGPAEVQVQSRPMDIEQSYKPPQKTYRVQPRPPRVKHRRKGPIARTTTESDCASLAHLGRSLVIMNQTSNRAPRRKGTELIPPPVTRKKISKVVSKKKKEVEKLYECGLCKNKFSTAGNLILHNRNMHGMISMRFKCDTCGESFLSQSYLDAHHLKTNHGGSGGKLKIGRK